MPQTIENTVKALTEFEAELDRVRTEVLETKRKMVRDAGEWAESAKTAAIDAAQKLADQRLSQARSDAEAEAAEIRKNGQVATEKFEESISKHRKEAVEHVLRRLLGEER
jgi:vacuolar-type H+-ATPase subunit H